jgi:hypothetical protein
MASITRSCRSDDRRSGAQAPLLLVLAFAHAMLLLPQPARADTLVARGASLAPGEEAWLLSADFDVALPAAVEDALSKGVSLFFVLELEVTRSRWYWFDQRAGSATQTYRLAYNTLTRQYRLSTGPLFQTFTSLEEALAMMGRVRRRPMLPANALARGSSYQAAVRMRLDISQLPRPFQASPFAAREWAVGSDWYRFTVTP